MQGVAFTVFDGATGQKLHSEEVPASLKGTDESAQQGSKRIDRCFLSSFPRKDGGSGWRLLALASDDLAVLLQQGNVVWRREESLSGRLDVATWGDSVMIVDASCM